MSCQAPRNVFEPWTTQADTGIAARRVSCSPMEVWPDIRALRAAALADESRLDVGQPNIIRPSVAADRGPMAAMVVGAIDQETANATGSHFSEGDLLWAGGHLSERFE